jgi:outer membrane immunogenic protein
MKHLVVSLISAVTLAAVGSAQAADMPVKAPIMKAAPFDPWTGFYAGGNIGYSWADWNSSNPVPGNTLAAAGFGNFGPGLQRTAKPGVDGWIGGLQAGYNWHVQPNWVFGLEGDFQWTGQKAWNNGQATLLTIPFLDGTLTGSVATANAWKLDWLSTIRARGGYLFAPQWLAYGTAGVAFGRAQYSNTTQSTLTFTGAAPFTLTGVATGSETKTETGWTAGAGVENQIARNWSAKIEYLYVDLGSHRFLGTRTLVTDVKLRDNIVRIGLNYQFH